MKSKQMSREEAIAKLEELEGLCLSAFFSLNKVIERDDEWIYKIAQDPHICLDCFFKGVPLINKGIKKIREEQGYTLEDMAKRTGIKKDTLKKYEEATFIYIPFSDAEKIRKALNCSKGYIIEMNDKEVANA